MTVTAQAAARALKKTSLKQLKRLVFKKEMSADVLSRIFMDEIYLIKFLFNRIYPHEYRRLSICDKTMEALGSLHEIAPLELAAQHRKNMKIEPVFLGMAPRYTGRAP